MRTIWKFQLEMGATDVMLPVGAKPLHFGVQGGIPTVWCLVNTERPFNMSRRFTVYGTGHPIHSEEKCHIGTCFDEGFVWHLFTDWDPLANSGGACAREMIPPPPPPSSPPASGYQTKGG